jgi:hypothetical protein
MDRSHTPHPGKPWPRGAWQGTDAVPEGGLRRELALGCREDQGKADFFLLDSGAPVSSWRELGFLLSW